MVQVSGVAAAGGWSMIAASAQPSVRPGAYRWACCIGPGQTPPPSRLARTPVTSMSALQPVEVLAVCGFAHLMDIEALEEQ